MARARRCTMGRKDRKKAPSYGYCAAQGTHFYGFKQRAACGLNGVIHSSDLTRASVYDLHYLKDVKAGYAHCTLLGDKDYISTLTILQYITTKTTSPSAGSSMR